MINRKCVLHAFSKYFLHHFLMNRDRLLLTQEYFSKIPIFKEMCYFPELYACKIGRI